MLKGQTAQTGVHLNTTYIHSFRDIQKTAARETNPTPQLPLTFLLLSGDLRGGNDKNKLSGKRPFLRMPFCVMFNHDRRKRF